MQVKQPTVKPDTRCKVYKIKAITPPKGITTSMEVGKIYEVGEEVRDVLVKRKLAQLVEK